jgi:hypothetical protein
MSGPVPRWRQGFGVYAAPAAWSVQLVLGYGLAAYACNPGRIALAQVAEGWGWTRGASLAVNLLAAVVAAGAGLVSLSGWRATGDDAGPARFLSIWGVLTSFGFLIAILFNTVMLVGAPACHG